MHEHPIKCGWLKVKQGYLELEDPHLKDELNDLGIVMSQDDS